MSTLRVMYVGRKERETDCVAGTGIVWVGQGDIKDVPAKAWATMAQHPDVWQLVDDNQAPQPTAPAVPATTLVVSDATGRSVEMTLVDGAYLLPAGVVFADAPKAPGLADADGKQPKFALQGPEGVIVLDGMSDAELAALAEKLGLDIDLRKKGDGRRAAILDGVEALGKKA